MTDVTSEVREKMNADHVEQEETPAMRITTSHNDHPEAPGASPQPSADQDGLPGIRHLVAVGSGKGDTDPEDHEVVFGTVKVRIDPASAPPPRRCHPGLQGRPQGRRVQHREPKRPALLRLRTVVLVTNDAPREAVDPLIRQNWADLSERLVKVLRLSTVPATEDGRRGPIPAGCVFWMHKAKRAFAMVPEDHGNCSVGSVTHGLLAPSELADHSDVAELVGAGWVCPNFLEQLPKVTGSQDRSSTRRSTGSRRRARAVRSVASGPVWAPRR
jgi:hypothetical protein